MQLNVKMLYEIKDVLRRLPDTKRSARTTFSSNNLGLLMCRELKLGNGPMDEIIVRIKENSINVCFSEMCFEKRVEFEMLHEQFDKQNFEKLCLNSLEMYKIISCHK